MTNLQILELNFNEISDISPLAELNNLYSVDLDNNQISSIAPLAELINLNSLTLNSNQISDIALLAGLPSLEMLDLNDNQITDVAPLAGLLNLTYLNLAGNEITDVAPLAGLSNLVELYIGGNHIADISPLRAVHQAIINSGYPQASFNASYQRIFFDVTSQSATVNNPLRQFDNTGIVPDTVQDQYASYDSGANQFKLFNLPELTSTEVALFALNCAQRPGQDPSMTVCFSGQLFARHSAPTVGTPTSGTPTAGAPKSGASSADYGAVALSVATLGFGAITLAIIKQRKLNFKR
jgi:Leucine-rich repeat (LRR) protein